MPDICMCNNDKCTKRKTCYRYMAIPNEHWQTYFGFETDETKVNFAKDCGYYIEVKLYDNVVYPMMRE